MELINCRKCGRMFNYVGGLRICTNCARELEEKFHEVKKYVYDHPAVGLKELSDEMDVSINQIKNWIREERLSFTNDSPIGLECEGCGVMIKTGKFCPSCKTKMIDRLDSAISKPKAPAPKPDKKDPKTRMRFIDR